MQIDGQRAPVPEDNKPKDTWVKFHKPFKYSPRGWDMVRIKPGETVALPAHIAKIAVADGVGEITEEEIKEPAAPAAASQPRGRGR